MDKLIMIKEDVEQTEERFPQQKQRKSIKFRDNPPCELCGGRKGYTKLYGIDDWFYRAHPACKTRVPTWVTKFYRDLKEGKVRQK